MPKRIIEKLLYAFIVHSDIEIIVQSLMVNEIS